MRSRLALLVSLTLLLCGVAALTSTAATENAPKADVCGSPTRSGPFLDPPDVVVSTLPTNSQGLHELTLAVHRHKDRYCYSYHVDGSVRTAAPTIRVHRGERFALRVVDDIPGQAKGEFVPSSALPPCKPMAMPDAPAVHYVGYLNHTIDDRWMPKLAVDTNIHLHGFEGPPSQENVFLSALSTPMHACEYAIEIPATQPPGTYFYHPHVHGGSEAQVAGGLGGVWIVEPDTPEIPRSDEHVLVLGYRWPAAIDNIFAPDDTALYIDATHHEASLRAAKPVPYDPFNPPAWPLSFPIRDAAFGLDPNGCDGILPDAVFVVNGFTTPASFGIPAGRTQLVRFVNATSDSEKMLKLRDSNGRVVPMHVVGLDGVPVGGDDAHPLDRYITVNKLVVSPMGRADILINAALGETVTLSTTHFCEGSYAFYQMNRDLVRITGTPPAPGDPPLQIASAPVDSSDTPAAKLLAFAREHPAMVRKRAITFSEYIFPAHGKIPLHQSYFATETTDSNFHEHPYYPEYAAGASFPANPDIVVKRGSIEEWYLFNTTMESHAFHIHQMAFVEESGPDGNPATVDTMFVPVGTLLRNERHPDYPLVKPSVTKVLLDFRNVPRGTFLFHCHMLFHEDRGMMGIIKVV